MMKKEQDELIQAEKIRAEIKELEIKGKKLCKKNGHSKIFYSFWGYIHCARCGEQIGDKLGGVFFGADKMIGVECQDNPCEICDPLIKKLNPFDKKMLELHKSLNKLGYAI
jgi:hypothetical protein